MKKIFFFLFLVAFISATKVYAQGARYGFKIGTSYSSISGYEYDVINSTGEAPIEAFESVEEGRFGVAVAFFAEVPISYDLSFQPEFAFSSQGNKFEGVRYDYLQVPLGFKINFNKLFLMAGPQAGLKISFSEQSENFTSFDFSAFGSLGYFFNESVFVEARFTQGFLEIFEEDSRVALPYIEEGLGNGNQTNNDNSLINNSGKNQYFTLSVGYRL